MPPIGEWFEDLGYHFHDGWKEHAEPGKMIPEALFAGVKRAVGDDFKADVTHPADIGGDISFVMVAEDDTTILVRFEPPSTTTISYLGSLAGPTSNGLVLRHRSSGTIFSRRT